ncbi:hypothetical protein [Butyrivibrio sp. WCD2001]|uniref:hypothetical protein n=1 Tax=Butyrivibrio sp. WCD2001 TaxID=1280681 RepID=UPI0003FD490F|nr:hypothetical protein [Butyrivibrio sp. WCD2001]
MIATNHLLLKFISKESYVNDFLNGSLYMNSLHYFWNEYPLLQGISRKESITTENIETNTNNIAGTTDYKMSPAQADMLEGTAGFAISEDIKNDFGEYVLTDAMLRAVGFQYCNTLCFYRLDYVHEQPYINYDVPDMSQFGEYVVIIKDKGELLRRIAAASIRENIYFLSGDVRYKAPRYDGEETDLSERHHVFIKAGQYFDLNDFKITRECDCFQKMNKYSWQKEWRVAIYRGVKSTEAYKLEIGDIRDIAECVPAKDLAMKLDALFASNKIRISDKGFYGNISRRDLREKYYLLGDNKAEMFFCIG